MGMMECIAHRYKLNQTENKETENKESSEKEDDKKCES